MGCAYLFEPVNFALHVFNLTDKFLIPLRIFVGVGYFQRAGDSLRPGETLPGTELGFIFARLHSNFPR